MDNNGGSAGDGSCHVSTTGVPNTRSSIATENTRLAPPAKQAYFSEERIHIPDTERVCTIILCSFMGDCDFECISLHFGHKCNILSNLSFTNHFAM